MSATDQAVAAVSDRRFSALRERRYRKQLSPTSDATYRNLKAGPTCGAGPGVVCSASLGESGQNMLLRMRLVNIERVRPAVDEVRIKLLSEIYRARWDGIRVLKVIHGYGSSGVGGKLRDAVREQLARLRERGTIKRCIWGEDWSIFDNTARRLLKHSPELKQDQDLERQNRGITIVLL